MKHFHINKVLWTRNVFKEIKVPKSRGALGTVFIHAPVIILRALLGDGNRAANCHLSFRAEDLLFIHLQKIHFHFSQNSYFSEIFPNLGISLVTSQHGNKQWTVNQVPARITCRAGASLSMELSFFDFFWNFRNLNRKYQLFKCPKWIELFHDIIISRFY